MPEWRLGRKKCNSPDLCSVFPLNPLMERTIMKEILIPAAAIFSIFGLPIMVMLAAVVATMLEKPRWALQN